VDVTLEEIASVPDSADEDAFWGQMETNGWAFLADAGAHYKAIRYTALPKTFALEGFDNDVFRSLAGFAREHGLIKRGKSLDEKAFFEFHWAFFFRIFGDGAGAGTGTGTVHPLWHRGIGASGHLGIGAPHVARGFRALMATAKQTPKVRTEL
jgi:hypothetical protein